MTNYTVLIAIEANTATEAAKVVTDWTLTPGAVLLSITGVPEHSAGLPTVADDDGHITIPSSPGAEPPGPQRSLDPRPEDGVDEATT